MDSQDKDYTLDCSDFYSAHSELTAHIHDTDDS